MLFFDLMAATTDAPSWEERLRKLGSEVRTTIGVTDWLSLSQLEVDLYGCLVEDLDPMHNDPAWPDGIKHWGGTIVIGSNLLSMLPRFLADVGLPVLEPDVDFGLEQLSRVRFIAPLPIDHRARARVELVELTERDDAWLAATEVTVEREGEERPFMFAASTASFRAKAAEE